MTTTSHMPRPYAYYLAASPRARCAGAEAVASACVGRALTCASNQKAPASSGSKQFSHVCFNAPRLQHKSTTAISGGTAKRHAPPCPSKTAEFALLHAPRSARLDVDLVAPSCPQLGVGFGPFDPPGTPRGPLQASHFAQFFSKGVPTGRAQSIRTHFATPRHALVRLPRPPNQGGGLGIAALGPLFIEQKFSRVTEHGLQSTVLLQRSTYLGRAPPRHRHPHSDIDAGAPADCIHGGHRSNLCQDENQGQSIDQAACNQGTGRYRQDLALERDYQHD
jgi:hypothetical protein